MLLKTARVKDFRCVEDSTEFSLEQVTCLVGKNESGKTSILKALHKLKPENHDKEQFKPDRDFPRRRWKPNEPTPKGQVVLTTWELSDDEWKTLEEEFGKGALKERTFTLSKGYDNIRSFGIAVHEPAVVKHLIASAELSVDERKLCADIKDLAALRKQLENIASRSDKQESLYQAILSGFPDDEAEPSIRKAVSAMVPTFLYFDQYLRLPGQVSVDAITTRRSEKKLTDEDRVFEALLALAGTSLEKLKQTDTFESFNASLRAVSNNISQQIFDYWTQNQHLEVQMRMDIGKPGDEAPFNSGYVFRTRIDNRRHKADTSFDDRSSGFVWFFSFLVWFYQLRETYKQNLVILLDEPGLALHARAQADLLRYINEQLRPEYQVVYTTHSPFMIDTDHILAARTVEDVVKVDKKTGQETLLGTKVSDKVLSVDPDTISPLQRALDYEMTQTLFIGRHTVLVEGPSDFLYLKWFSQQLEKRGKKGLDYRWNISIVGGVDRIPGFVSLFRGNRLQVAALVDVQNGDKQKRENAQKALAANHLLTVTDYTNAKEGDIEDVLGRDFYIELVNKAFQLHHTEQLPNDTLPVSGRVAKDVEEAFNVMPPHVKEFDHFIPAEFLFQNADAGAQFPGFDEALGRMEKCIGEINALLPAP